MGLIARAVTGVAALGIAAGIVPALAAPASAAAVTAQAPAGVRVERTGATQTTLNITWRAVAGVDHYTVSIFDGKTDTVRTVAAGTTAFTYAGSGNCTRYRVRVAAVMPDGTAAQGGAVLVGTLAPGEHDPRGPRHPRRGRSAAVRPGGVAAGNNGAVATYGVTVTELASGKKFVTRDSADNVEVIRGLSPARVYVAKITPKNAYGNPASPAPSSSATACPALPPGALAVTILLFPLALPCLGRAPRGPATVRSPHTASATARAASRRGSPSPAAPPASTSTRTRTGPSRSARSRATTSARGARR